MRKLITKGLLPCSLLLLAAGCVQTKQTLEPAGIACGAGQVSARCIARYFTESGSFYMTEQTHRFCPQSLSLEIQSSEPRGKLVCRMNGQNFQWSGVNTSEKDTWPPLCRADILAAVFYGFTAGGGLLNIKEQGAEPVKLEGRWYVPIAMKGAGPDLEITAMRNLSSGLIDTVKTENRTGGAALLAVSSQPWYVERLNKSLPKKIDIFDISSGVWSKRLILQVGYIDFQ